MDLPTPRGPVSGRLCSVLGRGVDASVEAADDPLTSETRRAVAVIDADGAVDAADGWLADEDLQLTLWMLYEQHYRGFAAVDPRWEWSPGLLRVRALIEAPFEAALRRAVPVPPAGTMTAHSLASVLFALVAADDGPSLSAHLARHGQLTQWQEFLALRSVYHLKEADPHTWAIPRLHGTPKAALVEIQADEYGGGRVERMHSELFRRSMRGLGLDDTYGAYVEAAPACTLANVNAMSMLGLHRRLRGAAVGHLTAVEIGSSVPSRRYATGLRRLGFGSEVTRFFDEHVEADAVHEQVAAWDLSGALARDEPELLEDVLFGAALCLWLDARGAATMLDAWRVGASALRRPVADLPRPA